MKKISIKSLRKTVILTAAFFGLTVFASQCFAQSSLNADDSARKDRQYIEIINSLYYYIQQNYVDEVDAQKLYEGALRGMLESLNDPYSVYMDESSWRSITDTTTGSFGGVGLSITKPTENKPDKPAYVEVAQPIDNSPGAKAGIQAGDLITEIDGVDTSTITMDEVLSKLRGTVGTSVEVTIKRGKNLTFKRTLVRAVIENPTVKYGVIGKTGYIRLSEFSSTTAERMQEALDSFKDSKVNGIIVDLRNNGGGLLTAAVDIADKFIDNGIIVSTKSRLAMENAVYTASRHETTVAKGTPVIVLINGASASASEILAGALKDAKVAYLVGEKSYGKGSVQIPTPLINKDGFKITVARYYSPSDVNIDKVGIPPDREVAYPEFTEEEAKLYASLLDSGKIEQYVEKHPGMTEDDIYSYAEILRRSYSLESRILRKLIRNECDRAKPSRLYDLDYDLQLKEALNIIEHENFAALISKAKTLKQIETERKAKEEKDASSAPAKK